MSSAKHVSQRMENTQNCMGMDKTPLTLSFASMARFSLRLRVLSTVTTSRSIPNAPYRLTLPFAINSDD